MSVRAQWGMECPNCGDDSHLMISVLASAMLSADGTEVYGDHEWDSESQCQCTVCQWAGKVHQTETAGARIAQLEAERDSWVIGHPSGWEEPDPEGWERANPDDAEELAELIAARESANA